MNEIFENLYDMTAFSNIIAEPQFLIMYAIAFVLLYLGIKKQYEPLLLVPIAFGVLLANFPGGDMGVIQADENGMVMIKASSCPFVDPLKSAVAIMSCSRTNCKYWLFMRTPVL